MNYNYQYPEYMDDRFLFTPFVVGGLAGTALGLGIANNNQINKQYPYYQYIPVYPYYPNQPYYSNNYYYY